MSKPRLLDLFCGAGGAAMGYHRAGFEVVGVDINPQPHYPFEFHQADALTFPLAGFDAIHASPPCQTYSAALRHMTTIGKWDALLEQTRTRLAGTTHVIENVPGAPIAHQPALFSLDGILLCGSMFRLGFDTPNGWREVRRHRLFESPIALDTPGPCRHRAWSLNPYNAIARARDGLVGSQSDRALIAGMGIDWCPDINQGREAIPPAYTEWIGRQLLAAIEKGGMTPRTAAGRALLASAWALGPGEPLMVDSILAIEAEAAAPGALDVERLARALCDTEDNGVLREAMGFGVCPQMDEHREAATFTAATYERLGREQ